MYRGQTDDSEGEPAAGNSNQGKYIPSYVKFWEQKLGGNNDLDAAELFVKKLRTMLRKFTNFLEQFSSAFQAQFLVHC